MQNSNWDYNLVYIWEWKIRIKRDKNYLIIKEREQEDKRYIVKENKRN